MFQKSAWTLALSVFVVGCGKNEIPDSVAGADTSDTSTSTGKKTESAKPPSLAKEKIDVDEVLTQAQQRIKDRDLDSAIQLAEKVLQAQPEHREALVLLAQTTQAHGMQLAMSGNRAKGNALIVESAETMRKLRATHGDLNEQEMALLAHALYNEACAYGFDGQTEKAVASLREAFGNGFADLGQVESDEDFNKVRSRP